MENELILVVEDSEELNNFISKNLRNQKYEVIQCFNAEEAFLQLSINSVSLVILDLNLGNGKSGLEILHSIRIQSKMLPVIIVSSISTEKTKIKGFSEGCDDYITKPFYIEELILRVKRMLEKFSFYGFETKEIKESYSCGIFKIDTTKQVVYKKEKEIPMRKKQFDLILYFIQNPNKILSFETIFQNVWNEPVPDEKTLESNIYVNIKTLRNLIEDDKKNPKHIISVSKCGYIFVP